MKKRARRIIVFVVLGLGVLLLFLHLPFVRKAALDRALRVAERRFGVELKASSLRYNLFRLEFSLKGVTLRTTGQADLPPLLTAERIYARIPISLILGKKVHLKELDIQGPKLSIFKDEEGRTNLPLLPMAQDRAPAETRRPRARIIIDSFLAQDVDFSYLNRAKALKIESTGARVGIRWLGRGVHSLVLALENGCSVDYKEKSFPIEALELNADIGREEGLLRNLTLRSGRSEIVITGRVQDYIHPLLGLGLQGRVSLNDLKAPLILQHEVAGTVELRARLEGPLQALSAQAKLVGENLSYAGLRNLRVQSDLRWQDRTLSVSSLRIDAPEGTVEGQGLFYPLDRTSANRVELSWESLDPSPFLRPLKLPLVIATRASGSLRASWTDPTVKSLTGRADIRFSTPREAHPVSAAVPLAGRAQIDAASGEIKLLLDGVSFGGALLGGAIQSAAGQLSGDFRVEIEDIGSLSPQLLRPVESRLARRPLLSSLRGRLSLFGKLGGTLQKPQIEGEFTGQELSWAASESLNFNGNFAFDGDAVRLRPLTLFQGGGQAEFEGVYRLRPLRLLDIDAKIEKWPVEPLLSVLGVAEDIAAKLDLDSHLSGRPGSPAFTLKGRLWRVRFRKRDLGEIPFEASSDGRSVNFVGRTSLLPLFAQGSLSLGRPRPLRLQLKFDNLPLEWVKNLALSVPPPDLSGVVSGRADVSTEVGRLRDALFFDLHISTLRLSTQRLQLASGREFFISYGRDGLSVKNLLLEDGRNRFSAEGTLPRRRASGGDSEAGLDVGAVLELGSLAGLFENSQGEGTITLKAQVRGSVSSPQFWAESSFAGTAWSWGETFSVQDIRAKIELAADAVQIREASCRWRNGSYSLEGEVPLESLPFKSPFFSPPAAGRPARLLLLFRGLSPSDPFAITGRPVFEGVKGTIDGRILITAERFRPDSLSATVELSRFDLDLPGLELAQGNPSRLRFEKGRVVLDRFDLSSGENRLQAAGFLELIGEGGIDLELKGDLDLRMLQAFAAKSQFSGRGAYGIALTGSFARPRVAGFIELHDGGIEAKRFHLNLSRLNGRILVSQNRLDVEGMSGLLNGGNVAADGNLIFEGLSLKSSDLRITGEDVFLDYPKGFFAETDFALQFVVRDEKPLLSGTFTVQTAEYVEPFNVQSELFRLLKRRPIRDRAIERQAFLNRLGFDILLAIRDAISVRNNLAKGQLQGELKLSGTPYQPVLAGRVVVAAGGEVTFSQNTYQIEQGRIDFVNPNRIEPDINLQAHTRVSGYDIKLLLTGPPDKLSASLTSDPPLSEPDIISLLVTGKRLAYVSDNVLGTFGDRALSYLNDALTGELENLAKQKLGLDSVTIDAGLISSQENPEARLTVGRHITPELEFILSQNLRKSQYTTVILDYKPFREINLRGVKQDNDAYRFDVQHEVRFGLAKKLVQQPGKTEVWPRAVTNLVLEGNLGLDKGTVRRSLKLSPGKRFDFVRYHDDLERLRRLYERYDYLNRSISAKREERDGGLTLVYRIESGPKILLRYEGARIPAALKKRVRALWVEGKLRSLASDDIRDELRRHFCRKGYYQAEVRQRESRGQTGEQVVSFQVERGVKFRNLEVDFKGVHSLSVRSLIAHLKKSRLLPEIFVGPQAVGRSLEGYYRQRGFLLARVGPPEVEFHLPERTSRARFAVDEGPRFRVGRIEFRGNLAVAESVLAEAAGLQSDAVFSPPVFEAALDRLREVYARRGFNGAEVEGESRPDKELGEVALLFDIRENRQEIFGDIEISGNSLTREWVIRRGLTFKEGDVLDHYALNKSQKNLYDLGILGRVQFTLKPDGEKESAVAPRYQAVEIEVTELSPFALRYGFQYDTETKFGVGGELVNRNVLGSSLLAGASLNLNRYESGAKAFFRSHYFIGKKINSELFTFVDRKILPAYTVDRTGLTLQQQLKIRQAWLLSYNYSFERSRVYDGAAGELEMSEAPINVGRLNFAVSANTRDDVMNPSRGMFFSQSLDYAAPVLGSGVRFVRYFGQYFFINNVTGPVSYALGLRLGLGKGFGGDLPLSERFFAGGGTSIRGFVYNGVGPKGPESRLPVGGDGLFILNQELRCDIYKRLGGVLFLDIGNIYAGLEDFNPFATREAAGLGLRLTTPVVLLRLDWGFKLDRRPGESRSELHFSIGQAF